MSGPFGHKAGCALTHAPGIAVATPDGDWAVDHDPRTYNIYTARDGTLSGSRWRVCKAVPDDVLRTALQRYDNGFWSCDCCGGFISNTYLISHRRHDRC